MEERELVLSKEYASWRRFVRALENVALAANLEKVGTKEERVAYAKLLRAERGGLAK